MVLWLIESSRKRRRLIDGSFRPCFYVQGPERRLACLAAALQARAPVSCVLTERQNIWDRQPLRVLQVSAHHPTLFAPLTRFVRRFDSSLILYNSDLMLASMYCWEKEIFPLARVEIEADPPAGRSPGLSGQRGSGDPSAGADATDQLWAIACRDDEWTIDYDRPPMRTMQLRLEGLSDVNPRHGRHGAVEVAIEDDWQVLDDSDEPVAVAFERLLRSYDPDVLVTEWGDDVLLPGLLRQAQRHRIHLPLNRDELPVARTRSRSYMSYGRILFKESTTSLFGRLHIDTQNSFIAEHSELEGLWELVRVTKLPVQYACRTTPGTGISYMQMEVAWRDGVLIPAQKAEPESPKHPDQLLLADRGGLVFPPRLGFFENVAELDFVSEFPSIMARFNISPETINCPCCPQAPRVPELGYRVCQRHRGITSRVVERLIAKRRQYKEKMRGPGSEVRSPESQSPSPESRVPDPAVYKHRRDVLKWLLVCCFGYTGYKNARFGKIEAHEAINAMAREKLLVAKEAAEQRGFRVLHALVDSLYVQKDVASSDSRGSSQTMAVQISEPSERSARLRRLLCGKPPAFRPNPSLCLPSVQPGRLSLPGCTDEVHQCFRATERRSLSAQQAAEPQNAPAAARATRQDYERLAQEIEQLTGLPLALEAVYRYVVFLPSRQSAEIPVPNRFFCVAETGELKVRGLECRRHDTPPFIARMQREVLAILAEAHDFAAYGAKLREAREVYERYLARLRDGSVAPEELVIRKRLTRAPASYQKNSVTAIAARQLDRAGVKLRPGENIEFIITDADSTFIDDRVRAWTLWEGWRGYDVEAYEEALEKAFEPVAHFVAGACEDRGQ
jgi:DNA polymerase elongation subunit (family B)